jgi:hypothetical protein
LYRLRDYHILKSKIDQRWSRCKGRIVAPIYTYIFSRPALFDEFISFTLLGEKVLRIKIYTVFVTDCGHKIEFVLRKSIALASTEKRKRCENAG